MRTLLSVRSTDISANLTTRRSTFSIVFVQLLPNSKNFQVLNLVRSSQIEAEWTIYAMPHI